MKKTWLIALFTFLVTASFAHAQNPLFFQSAFNTQTAATPTFSPVSPYSGGSTTVTISDSTSGAAIVYCQDTTNTCTPSTSGTSVSFTTTGYIRAQATASGYNASPIASWQGTYQLIPSITSSDVNTAAMNFGSGSIALSPSALAGSVVIVAFTQGAADNPVTVTDNNSNALTQCAIAPQFTGTQGLGNFSFFSYTVPVGGATSLNFAFSGSYGEAIAFVATNLSSPTCAAVTTQVSIYGNTNPLPTASPTASPSLALGVFAGPAGGFVAGTGWTGMPIVNTTGSTMFGEWKSATGTSPISAPLNGAGYAPDGVIAIWQ